MVTVCGLDPGADLGGLRRGGRGVDGLCGGSLETGEGPALCVRGALVTSWSGSESLGAILSSSEQMGAVEGNSEQYD